MSSSPLPGHVIIVEATQARTKTVDNLLVAGRCISTDLPTQVYTRLIPQCVSTGQAAGVAAAFAVRNAMLPRDFTGLEEAPMLQEALIRQRVNLESRGEE
jgi:FAD dependent oxidoreductase